MSVQHTCDNCGETLETEMKRKKFEPPPIKTLDKRIQVARNAYAFFDMNVGSIELGCEEKFTATAIWHEVIHMVLFEQFYLEANFMWDNIAHELQEYLFNEFPPEKPYNITLPAIKAKELDDGWRLGRKQKEKSERVGWKPDTKKRVPIRSHIEIIENMSQP
jgi:hypothetical protein